MFRNRRLFGTAIAGLAVAGLSAGASAANDTVSRVGDRERVALTLYADDLALIKDVRRVRLGRDANRLSWLDVAAQLRPETVRLRNLSNPAGFRVSEQAFDFDLLTPESLIEHYVGREVGVIRTDPGTGAESREKATLLTSRGGVVLQFADRVETGMPARLAFPAVPDTLHTAPALVFSLADVRAGAQRLELSYLASGLSWRADYVVELGDDGAHLDFDGWVTLVNQSGAAYRDARLQLVAGTLNRVRDGVQPLARESMALGAKAAGGAYLQPEPLAGHHLYTLPQPTSLAENQTKQVALLRAARVPVRKEFVLQGVGHIYSGRYPAPAQPAHVGMFLEFENPGAGLGLPLPAGVVRVYERDARGSSQFVGEDRIGHTPRNETLRLTLGEAFDLTAERRQTAFEQRSGTQRDAAVYESAHEVVLKNAGKETATVTVREPIPGDWEILSESRPHARPDAGTAEWKLRVPGGGKATLAYRVRVKGLTQ